MPPPTRWRASSRAASLRDYAIAFARPAPSTLQGELAQRNNKVQAIEHIRFKAAFEGLGVSAQQPRPGLNAHHHPAAGCQASTI
ncbi:MAG: hypothetical protein WDN30_06505 [Pararobbsia sp.]